MTLRSDQALTDLLEHPIEDLDVECKAWLNLADEEHRADLAKALLALANYGGGTVVLGVADGANQPDVDHHPGNDQVHVSYSQDRLTG